MSRCNGDRRTRPLGGSVGHLRANDGQAIGAPLINSSSLGSVVTGFLPRAVHLAGKQVKADLPAVSNNEQEFVQ